MAVALTLEYLFLWFLLYAFIGWVYESVLVSVSERRWVNRGFLNGPLCPIYGCGAVLAIVLLHDFTNPIEIFLISSFGASILEYITSWGMEKLFHARWWDYSKRKFNIGGRVCLIGAVVFGAFSVVLILVLHPFIKSLTDRLTDPALNIICAMLFIDIVSDLIVTVKGLLGTHAVFAEYAVLLQQKRRELSEKLRLGAEEGRERIRERGSEELAKLREAAELGAEEREKIRRTTEEERERFYAKLQMRLNAQQRRTINSFPQWKLTRNNEVLDGLREAMEKARKRRSSGKDEPAKTH